MNLILFDNDECQSRTDGDIQITLADKDRRAVHMRNVLKTVDGDTLRVGIIGGQMYDADVSVNGETYTLTLRSSKLRMTSVDADNDISLILAFPRPKALIRMLPVFSQQGVKKVALCNASRVEKSYWGSHVLNESFYRPLLVKGLEQASVSTRLPLFSSDPRPLDQFLKRLDVEFPNFVRILAHPQENCHLGDFLFDECLKRKQALLPLQLVVAIGPEGGWLDFEIELLVKEHGFICASFSPRVLTTDIAVVSVVTLISDTIRRAQKAISTS